VNIIATSDAAWHEKFKLASDTAKVLNLLDKQDRITLFQAILYGNRHERAFGAMVADPPFCQGLPIPSQDTP
jgi:hypothetical protein